MIQKFFYILSYIFLFFLFWFFNLLLFSSLLFSFLFFSFLFFSFQGQAVALELRRRGHLVFGLVRDAAKATELRKGEVELVVGDISKPGSYLHFFVSKFI